MTELKLLRGLSSKIPAIKDGQIIYCIDDNRFYIDIGAARKQVNAVTTDDIVYSVDNTILSSIISSYIMNIDYSQHLAFDLEEIVFGTQIKDDENEDNNDNENTQPDNTLTPSAAVLGFAKLGIMVLGQEK